MIDDELWAIDDFRYFLEGYDDFVIAGEYTSADAAWEYIAKNEPDVVFTDIKMKNTTGLQLAERAGEAGIGSLFVMVSAYDDFAYALKALNIGAFDYLLKPLTRESVDRIVGKLRKHFEKGEFVRKNYELPHSSGNDVFRSIVGYLQDNYMQQIQISDITEMFHISKSYCTMLCQKHYNMGFSKLLTKIRMENARLMLIYDNIEIKEVAFRTGFYDYGYFHKKFKQYFNMTPNQMKLNSGEKNEEKE